MYEEVELKLELADEAADFLEGSALLQGKASRQVLRATYFDTPDQMLRNNGLSLRIRSDGKKRVQTIKADGGGTAGLFARSEWERSVTGDVPVPDAETPLPALLEDRMSRLAPVFDVEVERKRWIIKHGGAQVELAVDRGAAIVADRRAPICEVELELRSGPVAALFDLARRIDAIVPVRLGTLTKSERGYGLLAPAPSAFMADPSPVHPAMTAGQAFQAIARSCIHHYRLNEALLLNHRNAQALHQARVAIRRLRSAFWIFRPILADPAADRFDTALRSLGTAMGVARNLDVLVAKALQDPLRARLIAARDAAYADVEAALGTEDVRRLMLDLTEWLTLGAWLTAAESAALRDAPIRDLADAALDRLRKRVRKGGRHIDRLGDEARHHVRKDVKKLRYAAEFFTRLYAHKQQRARRRKFTHAAEALQDQLGALNDLATAPRLFAELGLGAEEDGVPVAGKSKKALLSAASKAWDGLVDRKKFWT